MPGGNDLMCIRFSPRQNHHIPAADLPEIDFLAGERYVLLTSARATVNKYITHPLLLLVAILALMLVSLRFLPGTPILAYCVVFISSSLLYWIICREALRTEASPAGLPGILLILFLVRASYIGMSPLGSDDVYRYMWDGRVQSAGINPYKYKPNDAALAHLHTAYLPSRVNHQEIATVYFPLGEWIFYAGYALSGEQAWGYQLLILLAEGLTIFGLLFALRRLSLSLWCVLLYAANPLAILQYALDLHMDAFGFPFLIFGLFLYEKKKSVASLVLLGLSLLVKPVALVILPILFFLERSIARKVLVATLPLLVLAVSFLPYIFNANPFEGLITFSKDWFFNGALFSVLFSFIPDNQTARLWCLAILVVFLSMLYLSKKSTREKMVLAVLLLILCSPVAHPWYMGWLVVLLPLAPLSSGIALAGTASLASVTFVTYQLEGVWKEYPSVLILEYVPVVVLLVVDLLGRNRGGSGEEAQGYS